MTTATTVSSIVLSAALVRRLQDAIHEMDAFVGTTAPPDIERFADQPVTGKTVSLPYEVADKLRHGLVQALETFDGDPIHEHIEDVNALRASFPKEDQAAFDAEVFDTFGNYARTTKETLSGGDPVSALMAMLGILDDDGDDDGDDSF